MIIHGMIFNRIYQGGLTQQLAAADQVTDGDMEVGVSTAPVGDLGEGVGDQNVLLNNKNTEITS